MTATLPSARRTSAGAGDRVCTGFISTSTTSLVAGQRGEQCRWTPRPRPMAAGDVVLRVETLVRATGAKELLLRLAEHAHVVVLGSRGLGSIGSLALGSISVAVASGANTPVVVVRTPGAGIPHPRRIVVGADGTAASAAALEFAFAQASARSVPLNVVHCSDERDPEVEGLRLAESVAGLQEKFIDVAATFEIVHGRADRYLVHASGDSDLVVVGARGHHGPAAALLGSVSQLVVERSSCSVAVVVGPR
ncbi:MAG TPA: universal stress protein [Nocardioidaceae bacterium]|nr:universal stress protein [Nocardioidaceae bacterium]